MNSSNTRLFAGNAGLLVLLLLTGCAGTSPQVDFYTLSPDTGTAALPATVQHCTDVSIGIGPVTWPRYLDQPRIVTRASPNKLEFNEFHRWGGTLQDDFERVLIRNLSGLLQSPRIGNFDRTARFKTDYRVELDIRQFDGQLGDAMTLDVKWGIIRQETGEVLVLENSLLQETATEPTHDALVNASSRAVAGLAREIAAALAGHCPGD